MAIKSDLIDRTMHLPLKDRAELARRLILSLEDKRVEEDVDEAWEMEIERRIAAYERGDTTAVDWQDAVARAKASLRKKNHK